VINDITAPPSCRDHPQRSKNEMNKIVIPMLTLILGLVAGILFSTFRRKEDPYIIQRTNEYGLSLSSANETNTDFFRIFNGQYDPIFTDNILEVNSFPDRKFFFQAKVDIDGSDHAFLQIGNRNEGYIRTLVLHDRTVIYRDTNMDFLPDEIETFYRDQSKPDSLERIEYKLEPVDPANASSRAGINLNQ
jgi:hypothetical protein